MFREFKPHPKPSKSNKKLTKRIGKHNKKWKPVTKLEKEYANAVSYLGCICCGRPASIHHINSGQKRMGHIFIIPLCWALHHEIAKESVGERKKLFIKAFGTELSLMLKLREILIKYYGDKFQEIFNRQDQRIYHGKIKYVI